jgi:hypothetical protein
MRQVVSFGRNALGSYVVRVELKKRFIFLLMMMMTIGLSILLMILAGTSVDQGIAYVLMLVALVLTYLIHPLDASSAYKLF